MSKPQSIFFATKASHLRWLMLAMIVGSAFSVDYFLERDISNKVSGAWQEACDQTKSTLICMERVATHHSACFELSYTSMMLTFGRSRWESFKLLDYEACMNRENEDSQATVGI